jgi:hypothetical protein
VATCMRTSEVAQIARTSPKAVCYWRHVGRSAGSVHPCTVAGAALTRVCGSESLAVVTPWVAANSDTSTAGTDAKSFQMGRRSVAHMAWLRQAPVPIEAVLRPPDHTLWPGRWPGRLAQLESSCCQA